MVLCISGFFKNLDLKSSCNCTIFSAVSLEDRSVSIATDQTITCVISGLSQDTSVTWIDPDDNVVSVSDADNYIVDQGSFVFGSKTASLTIKTAKLADLSSGDVYKCKLRSSRYPDNSPDVVKEMVLTLLSLGEIVVMCKSRGVSFYCQTSSVLNWF